MTEFALLSIKSTPTDREKVSWAMQHGPSDPAAALKNHLAVNNPPQDHLLTKAKFLKVLTDALKTAGLQPLQGHGIHVGATLEYLLHGVLFNVMKVIGHWAISVFEIYLWKHA
ncbi:hypothetical protein B0H10DRAFT_1941707 [Mycena sp. CBHHK59/15]|nr:hypothetical protein B0H10DRAFT_1941707 [Mycena sp. CBHHK59/15]